MAMFLFAYEVAECVYYASFFPHLSVVYFSLMKRRAPIAISKHNEIIYTSIVIIIITDIIYIGFDSAGMRGQII